MHHQPDRLAERLATLEEQMRGLTADVGDLERELRGPGGVQPRLHKLENDAAAASLAEAALEKRSAGFDRRAALVLAAVVAGVNVVLFAIELAVK